ncbi:hypothetical protein B0H11DRAFT_235557 [Mycena galericulata]|nr:hypothetical protein B0H11DRAFT_235557 [Mycena galericulata]
MSHKTPRASNQAILLCTSAVPAFSLLPLLALLILVMKRKRHPSTTDDPEDQGSSETESHTTMASAGEKTASNAPHRQAPPPKKQKKAIPRRMLHMKNNMTVWGDRWLPAIQPSTAGSQQGEIDPSGIYTASRSPPPAYRATPLPLSPVVMTSSSSSPNPHPLSSDFEFVDDFSAPPPSISHSSTSLDGIFLFGGGFGSGGGSLGQSSNSDDALSYCTFQENHRPFEFNPDASSSFSHTSHPSYNASPSIQSSASFTSSFPNQFSNPMTSMDLHPESSFARISSGLDNSQYPVYGGAGSFSDWIPPAVPLHNVAHLMDGFPYPSSLDSFPSPSQSTSGFSAAVWKPNSSTHYGGAMPMVAGHSTPPMYTQQGSPYLAMTAGSYSPVYRRSGSGSPIALYSGQPSQYHPHTAPLPPLAMRTTSSGSLASLSSMDGHSPHSSSSDQMKYSQSMSGYSDYGDVGYSYSSPQHSGVFTASPGSVSSMYRGNEGAYTHTSRTVPLPFHNPPPPCHNSNWSL